MQNKKSIYISLIVKDLARSTAFYETIGCTKNVAFSDDKAAAMVWSEEISFMLLTEQFASNFSDGKDLANQKKTVSAFYSLVLESKEAVDEFCKKSRDFGARVYVNKFNQEIAGDFMYTFEVEDPDGYILEPMFMDTTKIPQE